MKVSEVIEALRAFPMDYDVYFDCENLLSEINYVGIGRCQYKPDGEPIVVLDSIKYGQHPL